MRANLNDLTGNLIQTGTATPLPPSSDPTNRRPGTATFPPSGAAPSSDPRATPDPTATPIQENFFVKVGNGNPPNIERDLIDEDTPIEREVYLLRRNDKKGAKLFPIANLSILKAQMKSGKTFVCTLFSSAVLSGTWEGQINAYTDEQATGNGDIPVDADAATDRPAVVYIDTEQSPAATKRIRQRITKLCTISRDYRAGEPCTRREVTPTDYKTAVNLLKNRLIVANLRRYNTAERLARVGAILERFAGKSSPYRVPVRFVVIDGIKDLCEDFNNIAAVAATMDKLTAWALAYNIHILCVLHENPSSDKARGHLGTELYNKATEVINVERVADSFAVKWDAIRDGAGVMPLYFSIDNAGDPSHPVPVYASAPDDTPDGNGDPDKDKGKGKQATTAAPKPKKNDPQMF